MEGEAQFLTAEDVGEENVGVEDFTELLEIAVGVRTDWLDERADDVDFRYVPFELDKATVVAVLEEHDLRREGEYN